MNYSNKLFGALAFPVILFMSYGYAAGGDNNIELSTQEQRYESVRDGFPFIYDNNAAIKPRYWQQIFPSGFDVIGAVKSESFAELEEYFLELHKKYETNDSYKFDDELELSYSVFSNTDPRLEKKYDKWIEKFPESYAAYTARGIFYLNIAWARRGAKFFSKTEVHQTQGMFDYIGSAESDFLRAVEIYDHAMLAYQGLLSVYNLLSVDEEFYGVLKYALSVRPTSYAVRKTAIFAMQPKWGGSLEEISKFIKDSERVYDSDDIRLSYLQSYIHYVRANITERENEREAIPHFNAAVADGKHWYYIYRRGVNYYHMKEYSKALADFNQAITLSPYSFGPREKRAWVYEYSGQHKEALEELNIALEIDALDSDALRARGKIHRKLGNFKQAETDLRNALIFGSTDKWNWHWLAEVYIFDYKDYGRAEEVLKHGLLFHPEEPYLWYDLAVAQTQIPNCEVMETFKAYLNVCKYVKCGKGDKKWILDAQKTFTNRKKCG